MLKKLLSLVITTLFLFQAIHFNLCTSYAVWTPWSSNKASENIANACERKNKYKNFADLTCAINDLKKSLHEERSAERLNVGEKGEYNIYMWDYRELGDFPSKMGSFLKNSKKGYIYTGALINLTNEVGGLINGVKGLLNIDSKSSGAVVSAFLSDNEYYSFSKEELAEIVKKVIDEEQLDKSDATLAGWVGAVAGGIVGAVTIGTGGAFLGFVGLGGLCHSAVSWWKGYSKNGQSEEYRIKIENYASALKQLLRNIQNGNWKNGDSVLAKLNFDPKYYSTTVTMVDSRIDYPETVKKGFDQKFKDLENNLTQMINENKN